MRAVDRVANGLDLVRQISASGGEVRRVLGLGRYAATEERVLKGHRGAGLSRDACLLVNPVLGHAHRIGAGVLKPAHGGALRVEAGGVEGVGRALGVIAADHLVDADAREVVHDVGDVAIHVEVGLARVRLRVGVEGVGDTLLAVLAEAIRVHIPHHLSGLIIGAVGCRLPPRLAQRAGDAAQVKHIGGARDGH